MPDPVAARLLEGAARCFVDVGVSKTTMAEIAAAAGVTKPTLYRRYPDKQAVVRELVRTESAAFARRVTEASGSVDDPVEGLAAAFAAAVRWLDRHPFLRRSLAREPHWLLPLLAEPGGPVREAATDAFAAVVRRGVAAGRLGRCDVDLVAEVWWRLALSYVVLPALGPAGGEERLRRTAREMLAAGGVREEST